MKLILIIATCVLTLRVESQSFFGQNQQYVDQYTGRSNALNYMPIQNITPLNNIHFAPNTQREPPKTDRDSYLQAISRNDNTPDQQFPNSKVTNDERIYFVQPSEELSPPPVGEHASQNYFSTQRNNAATVHATQSLDAVQQIKQGEEAALRAVTMAVTDFGLRLVKTASQQKVGNLIMSPTSTAMMLALLQQGATGEAQMQVTRALNMSPDFSKTVFGLIAANVQNRNSQNILSIANSMFVSDTFELNHMFRSLAINTFRSDLFSTNFANPTEATDKINRWVATKTHEKITNLLFPGAVSPSSQLVLVNAVYFKGVWQTKFRPERTQKDMFHLSNGEKKLVPFMHIRHTYQVGLDQNTRALVTILPFEGNQYSLILILPKKTDSLTNVLSTLTTEQLLSYQSFAEDEIAVDLPKFTLKTDTDLNPVLKNMNITNIFGSKSELTGIGLFSNSPPQISSALHSGFLSIDEQGVTAAAATAVVAVALSYDDSITSFRADRPFIAVLWDKQLSMPIFISRIEDPS